MSNSGRRQFLKSGGSLLGLGWARMNWPVLLAASQVACARRDEGAEYVRLSEAEGRELEAIAEQIMPGDDTPGAMEAGVVWFIDELLGRDPDMHDYLRDGLSELQARVPGGAAFSELEFEQQTDLLRSIESGGFFQNMRMLTLCGMFALPSWGGNRDEAGWKLLGFEDRHAWQPPFGHYDGASGENSGENDDV